MEGLIGQVMSFKVAVVDVHLPSPLFGVKSQMVYGLANEDSSEEMRPLYMTNDLVELCQNRPGRRYVSVPEISDGFAI